MPKRLTTQEFITKAKSIHGDKFDYSLVEYISSNTPVTIICPIHGKFTMRPNLHLTSNYGCGRCGESNKGKWKTLSTKDFISKAIAIHGEKYDYSKVHYVDTYVKVCIICPTHGDFLQRPNDHLDGHGCKFCRNKGLIYGVAINDTKGQNQTAAYKVWSSMLLRCYDMKHHLREPSYIGCSVCDEWLVFSNFQAWFNNPDNGHFVGCQLDKDLLVSGNRIYSPLTCCFLPREINTLIHIHKQNNRGVPVGVLPHANKFRASLSVYGKNKHLGLYPTAEQAFLAYKNVKEKYIKELAEKYFKEGKITERVYNALLKYEVVD